MSDWWTYTLSDFLMFSARTYWRLVEDHNRHLWPAQLAGLAAGLLLLWLAATRRPAATRLAAVLLAAAWAWVGWTFHWQRYAAINWAASWFAAAFWLQAALLLVFAALCGRGAYPRAARTGVRAAGYILLFAALLYPVAGVLAGRPWIQTEVFGAMPDPTALGTIGFLLASRCSPPRWLSIVPLLSLLVGLATLWLLSGG